MVKFSIFGDSVSTFHGFNPNGYSVFFTPDIAEKNGLTCYKDTWWQKVIDRSGGQLCVNDSYSGSRVSGPGFPSACSPERISAIKSAQSFPDVILVYLGANDFIRGVKCMPDPSYAGTPDCSIFYCSYRIMLQRLVKCCPDAQIICATLMRTRVRGHEEWQFPDNYNGCAPFSEYNSAIRAACTEENVFIADLDASGARYETLDGSHPDFAGHKTLAACWMAALKAIM